MITLVKVKTLCVFELIHFLLPTAVCRLLVLHPSKLVLDKVAAAAEEEQRKAQMFTDAFRAKEQIY